MAGLVVLMAISLALMFFAHAWLKIAVFTPGTFSKASSMHQKQPPAKMAVSLRRTWARLPPRRFAGDGCPS